MFKTKNSPGSLFSSSVCIRLYLSEYFRLLNQQFKDSSLFIIFVKLFQQSEYNELYSKRF